MLRKWIAEIFAFIISASSLTQLHGQQAYFPNTGKQVVAEVESSFQKGEYERFLEKLHEQYQNAGKAGLIRGIFEKATTAMKADVNENLEKLRVQMIELNQERNRHLLDAVSEHSEMSIAQRVDSVVFFDPPSKHKEVLEELETFKQQVPKSEEKTAKNRIAALELEYYIKSLLLDVAAHRISNTSDELSKKKIVLTFAKFDKMENFAKAMQDNSWIEKIQTAKKAFRAEKAFKIDFEFLQELATGNINPENLVEEKVKQIMMDYLDKKRAYSGERFSEIVQNR